MSTTLIDTVISTPAGQFVRAVWSRNCKVKKGVTECPVKTVSGVFRVGIDYDAVKDVKDGRENGTLPSESAGLPWGVWRIFPRLINHKETDYVRLYYASGEGGKLDRIKSVYTLNGKEISREELQAMGICLASEFRDEKPDEELNTFTVKADSFLVFGDWRK